MKLERHLRSALRLPRRLAHVFRVALQLAGWTVTLQLRAGLRRRRHARLLRRCGLFDVPFYLAQCGDDPAARKDPFTHYLVRGAARGLAPSPLFDGAAYLARTPGVAPENPLVHHLLSRCPRAQAPALASPPPAPACDGEALLRAHPFRPRVGASRRVLVMDGDAPAERGAASGRSAELVRFARELGPVTLVSDRAAPGPSSGAAEVLHGFPAVLAHLAAEGELYDVVLVRGLEQVSRYLAPVRAFAAQGMLIWDAGGAVPRDPEVGSEGERRARVAAACCDLVLVDAPAEREAIQRLASDARVEVLSRPGVALAAILARPQAAARAGADDARLAGGAA